MTLTLTATSEHWPLAEAFTIARGSKNSAHVVVVTATDGAYVGRGEATPYARYGESVEHALRDIDALDRIGLDRRTLAERMSAGAARNAIDAALWDLEAKRSGRSAATLAGLEAPRQPVVTAYTLSLGAPDAMAEKARAARQMPLLKLKLGGTGDAERMRAVRAARPDARLIADANEAWRVEAMPLLMAVAGEVGIETIEQPLPEADDEALRGLERTTPICADESLRTAADLPRLIGLYDAVNIKLDKAGGLTAAIELASAARAAQLRIMVGSMVATSLAAAPALLLAGGADWVDLDGPLLLARDRPHGLAIRDGVISPADQRLWG